MVLEEWNINSPCQAALSHPIADSLTWLFPVVFYSLFNILRICVQVWLLSVPWMKTCVGSAWMLWSTVSCLSVVTWSPAPGVARKWTSVPSAGSMWCELYMSLSPKHTNTHTDSLHLPDWISFWKVILWLHPKFLHKRTSDRLGTQRLCLISVFECTLVDFS